MPKRLARRGRQGFVYRPFTKLRQDMMDGDEYISFERRLTFIHARIDLNGSEPPRTFHFKLFARVTSPFARGKARADGSGKWARGGGGLWINYRFYP